MKGHIDKICFILVMFIGTCVHAQETEQYASNETQFTTTHSLTLITQYLSIKDEFNYGLAFQGLNLGIGYTLDKARDKSMFSFAPDLAFGANFNKGVGLAWHFKPIDVFYGFKVNKDLPRPLFVGAYFATNYNWQLYPELQSGHMFWWSSFELGPELYYKLPIKGRVLNLSFSTSLLGWTSRPEPSTETHFYSLTFSDFVNNPHSNLTFGTSMDFNHTNIRIELQNTLEKRLSVAYEFAYFSIYDSPQITQLTHTIHLNWIIGKMQ